MATPRNYVDVESQTSLVRNHFSDKLDRPCLIVGNGPSSSTVQLTGEELERFVIFRMNWFMLEREQTYGSRVDGFFCSIENVGLLDRLQEEQSLGRYQIGAYFHPFDPTDLDNGKARHRVELQPSFDHWAVIATHPTLARFFMGRPLPTQGMQVIAFAAALGFKDIRIAGIDMYADVAARYAWDVPDDVKKHLESKDVRPGYESKHSLDVDLMLLRTVRSLFDIKLSGMSEMDILAPLLDHSPTRSGEGKLSEDSPGPKQAYVTLVEGDGYLLGAKALARSLKAVSNYPLVALYTDDAVGHQLSKLSNVIPRRVEKLENPHSHGQDRFLSTFTKLRVFELFDFERLVFVDADCVFLKNCDELFAGSEFLAAPNWGINLTRDFNSGVFAFSPSQELCDLVQGGVGEHPSNDGGDQGYLNTVLSDQWKALPPEYNTLKRLPVFHPALVSISNVKILHYVGKKPWDVDVDHAEYGFLLHYWCSFLEKSDWVDFYWRQYTGNMKNRKKTKKPSIKRKIIRAGRRITPDAAVPYVKGVMKSMRVI